MSTLPQEYALTRYIRAFTEPSLPHFPFGSLWNALSISHAISLFSDFIQGKPFLGKSTYFLNQNQSDFFTLHTFGKLRIFRCKPHLNWVIISSSRYKHAHYRNTNGFEF